MLKLFFFPSQNTNPPSNPYVENFKNSIDNYYFVIEKNRIQKRCIRFRLLYKAWSADIYVLNWIESIKGGFSNLILFIVSYLALFVISFRKKKIIWVLHNLHPHFGENRFSKIIQLFLFKHSALIITHSKEAACYAQNNALCPVRYISHPIKKFHNNVSISSVNVYSDKILIWGSVLSYKGIPEFLALYTSRGGGLSIHIIGECKDVVLNDKISSFCNDRIVFENRRADYEEIEKLIRESRYVLFPYIGDSISSSGALIDTIVMGGVPIGPDRGAFKDLKDEGVCLTYENEDDLFRILSKRPSKIDYSSFIEKNSWENFGKFFFNEVQKINKKC